MLDSDKIRERLLKYTNRDRTPLDVLAMRIGISKDTLLKFMHGARKPFRKTLIAIDQWLLKQEARHNGKEE